MARKNANGEGSRPRQRADGRWETRYWKDGKRRSVYGGSRKEAADKLATTMVDDDEQPGFVPSSITVAEFFAQYEDAAKHTMKRRSLETLRDIARLHLLPAFGTAKLTDLSRERVQRLYSDKLDAGLSAARVRRIHGAFTSALNTAVRWGLIERNVCEEVLPPRVPQPEIRPFNKQEAKRFLAAAEGDRYEALFVLGLTSGARWGELTGLFWSDLDLDRGVMYIQRNLINGYGGHTFDTPKTRGSRRSVGLTRLAVEALKRREHRGGLGFRDHRGHRELGPAHLPPRAEALAVAGGVRRRSL